MSRRRNSKRTPKRDLARETAVLESTVRLDGEGEYPAVRGILSDKFIEGTDTEALDIALAFQQLLRGQTSLLENQERFSGELAALRKRMAEQEEAARRWNEDQEGFLRDAHEEAERVRKNTAPRKDEIIAKASIQQQQANQQAVARKFTGNLEYDAYLNSEPTEIITSPGEHITVMEGGQSVPRIVPEVIRIRHRTFVLPPGEPVSVPHTVAERFRQKQQELQENSVFSDIYKLKGGKMTNQHEHATQARKLRELANSGTHIDPALLTPVV